MFDAGGPRFEQSLQGPLSFTNVEFVRRNHAVGLYYSENLTLRPWTSVSDEAHLGVDAKGRAFHILQLKDRRVGYLLSGQRRMRALFLSDSGHLFGLDSSGRLLQYSPEVWGKSAWSKIVRKTMGYYGLSVLAAVATTAGAQWLTSGGFPGIDGVTWAVAAFGSIASLMSWGAFALNRWERQNEMTDGFVPVGGKIGAVRSYDREGDDYRLNTETGVHSLREIVAGSNWRPDWTENFHVQDKHEQLPRGIDPKTYEPEIR